MNCFEFRKLLLMDPRVRTPEQERHLAECDACQSLVRETEVFEIRVNDAMRVPVPEALAERVLLRRKMIRTPSLHAWALAASLVAAIGLGVYYHLPADDREERVFAAATLGGAHPAVAAIAYVVEHEPELLQKGVRGDPEVMRGALLRLGLKLPAEGVTVQYLGKCPVPGGTGEHIVLQSPHGQVTLILVPDRPLGPRVAVADRQMTALANSIRSGGYILIADSIDRVKQIEMMLL